MFKKINIVDFICLLPVIIFFLLTISYWGQSPSLDPMVIYRESTQFFNGGIKEIISNGIRIHPPLIYILNSLTFLILGKNPGSYNFVGVSILTIDSVFLYFVTKNIFNRKIAIPLTILLFSNPFVIINSFYLVNDMLILSGLIFSLGFYLYNKKLLLSITLALMVLMKEAALIIILSLFFIMTIYTIIVKHGQRKLIINFIKTILVFLPALIIFFLWSYYLKSLGTTEWRESFFIKTNDSSYITVIKNLLNFKFLNIFLYQNLRNTFVLNFQWVYSISTIIFLIIIKKRKLFKNSTQKRYFYIMLFSGVMYILLIFSFPTWTVPRYGLPVFLPLFFFLTFFLSHIKWKILYSLFLTIFFSITLFSNLFSIDPVSKTFGEIDIQGENFYNIDFWNSGPDRIIYNTQFLKLVINQNNLIKTAINKNPDIIVTYCDDLKLREKIYSINIHNLFYPQLKLNKFLECINNYDLDKAWTREKLYNKIVYSPNSQGKGLNDILLNNGIHASKVITNE